MSAQTAIWVEPSTHFAQLPSVLIKPQTKFEQIGFVKFVGVAAIRGKGSQHTVGYTSASR